MTLRERIFADIRDVRWLYVKAGMLLFIGVAAAFLLWIDHPTMRSALLLALTIWGFCRAYYFAFYVIEHYADPGFRFSGLLAFCRYAFSRGRRRG